MGSRQRMLPHLVLLLAVAAWVIAGLWKLAAPGGIGHGLRRTCLVALAIGSAAGAAGLVYLLRLTRDAAFRSTSPAASASTRVLAILAGSFWVAATWPGPAHSPVHVGNINKFQAFAGILLASWLSLAFVAPRRPRLWNRTLRLAHLASKIAWASLLFLALLEGSVVLLDPVFARRLGDAAASGQRSQGPRYLPVPGSLGQTNAGGFNDVEWVKPKPPGVVRVAALGDSFAFGTVSYDENFLTLLEKHTAMPPGKTLEVLNLGQPGTSPEGYLTCLRRFGLGYEPDLVLLNFFIGNDFDVKAQFKSIVVAGHECEGVQKGNRFTDFLYKENWHFYHLLRMLVAAHSGLERPQEQPHAASSATAGVRDYSQPTYTAGRYLAIQSDRAVIFRRGDGRRVLEDRWARTRTYLDEIHRECSQRRIPLALAILPDEFQVDAEERQKVLAHWGQDESGVDLEAPGRILVDYASAQGLLWIDLLSAFQGAREKTSLYIPRDTHWNPAGNRLAAEQIAVFLKQALAEATAHETR
ncbi:MAG: SGNH/GDSL hydrolase family protein [Planctomycetes bacterium]|nr:SGNH/GDSL hydrolase family protein [Planctomycetota bacterium]